MKRKSNPCRLEKGLVKTLRGFRSTNKDITVHAGGTEFKGTVIDVSDDVVRLQSGNRTAPICWEIPLSHVIAIEYRLPAM